MFINERRMCGKYEVKIRFVPLLLRIIYEMRCHCIIHRANVYVVFLADFELGRIARMHNSLSTALTTIIPARKYNEDEHGEKNIRAEDICF